MAKFELKNHVFPLPKDYKEDGQVKIGNFSKAYLNLITKEKGDLIDSAKEVIEKALLSTAASKLCCECGFPVTLAIDKRGKKPEGYTLEVTDTGATIKGYDPAGVFYGAITLSKLIFVVGDEVFIDKAKIKDEPAVATRGAFIESRHNDFHTYKDWCDMIDYYADIKINKIEVSVYGCWPVQFDNMPSEYLFVPIKGHPELSSPKQIKYYSAKKRGWVYRENVLPTMFEEDFLGEVIAYGKKKNVEVFPLFNSFGHNSLIPRTIPEVSAKDLDGNPTLCGFCTNNPATLELLCSIYDEIIDRYLAPNGIKSFAIGMDEVYALAGIDPKEPYKVCDPYCKCPKCRDLDKTTIMLELNIQLTKHLKKRGMENVYIYHDIFYENNMINEDLVKRFKDEGIYDVTVFDWWSYAAGEKLFRGRVGEMNNLFRSTMKTWNGYYHWSHYCDAWPNIYECAEIAKRLNYEGMLYYTAFDYSFDLSNKYYSECCWAMDAIAIDGFKSRYFACEYPDYPVTARTEWDKFEEISNHYINNTMYYPNLKVPQIIGLTALTPHSYISVPYNGADPGTKPPYPRYFMNETGKKISENRIEYVPMLRKRLERASDFLEFLNSDKATPSATNERMKFIAMNHKVHADVFHTLNVISDRIGEGEYDNRYAIAELKRLIRELDAYIYQIESVKFETHHPTTCRLVSKMRLYLTEQIAKFEEAEAKGEIYKYDIATAQDWTAGLLFLG